MALPLCNPSPRQSIFKRTLPLYIHIYTYIQPCSPSASATASTASNHACVGIAWRNAEPIGLHPCIASLSLQPPGLMRSIIASIIPDQDDGEGYAWVTFQSQQLDGFSNEAELPGAETVPDEPVPPVGRCLRPTRTVTDSMEQELLSQLTVLDEVPVPATSVAEAGKAAKVVNPKHQLSIQTAMAMSTAKPNSASVPDNLEVEVAQELGEPAEGAPSAPPSAQPEPSAQPSAQLVQADGVQHPGKPGKLECEAEGPLESHEPPTLPDSFAARSSAERCKGPKVVKSMAESFLFEEDCFETLFQEEGEDKVLKIYDAITSDTFSTSFSGVEAAGTAVNCLRQAWSNKTGMALQPTAATYQIEWNRDCVAELLPHCKKYATCLFRNIAQFYRAELKEIVERLLQQPQMAVEVLAPLLVNKRAMKLEAWCETHERVCSLRTCRRHLAGTSCRPWSRKGVGLGSGDPEILYTLAWIGLRLMLEDTEIVSENVKTVGAAGLGSFVASAARADNEGDENPVMDAGLGNLFLRFLAPMYHLETTVLDPSMIGDPFSRDREFVKMYHKVKVLSRLSPISRFQKRFYRACAWSWQSLLMKISSGFGIFS